MQVIPYYDCYEAIIADLLKNSGLKSESFFNKAGLAIYIEEKDKSDINILITHRDNLYEEELAETYNLSLIPQNAEVENIIAEIDSKLDKNLMVIGAADTYHLPYCRAFQKEHYFHFLQIIKKEEDYYHIIDNFYRYKGKIKKKLMANYLEAGGKIGNYNYLYYDPSKIKINDTKGKKDKIKLTYELMIDYKRYKNPSNVDLYVGINGIVKIQELINHAFISKNMVLMDKLSTGITKLTYSRRHFYDFVKGVDIELLEKNYFACYQKWQILQNYLLKIVFLNRFEESLLEKINKAMYEIINVEIMCMNKIQDIN